MKRRILSLLLALCLVVGLLPMMAWAEEGETPALTSSLVVTTGTNEDPVQWKPSLSEGMAPAYAKNTAEGALVLEGATEADYNLKAEWPTGGKPTLTLNNATLANDTHTVDSADGKTTIYTVIHTIRIGGNSPFEILLKGTNTINGCLNIGSTTMANHRGAAGIYATNTALLTIKSVDKAVDTLLIDVAGANGIYREYNALTIDSANITINMRNTGSNGQVGIVMVTGGTAYADLTNLTVKNSIFTIKASGKYLGNSFIFMGKAGATYSSENTGDILFQNSKVVMNRNNGSSANSSGAETIKFGPNSTFVVDRCDFAAYGNHRTFNRAPTFVNCTGVQNRNGWSTWSDYAFTPGAAISSSTNNSAFKATHVCLAGEPVVNKPAGECATQQTIFTYCVVCNAELSRVVEDLEGTPSKVHTPGKKELLSKVDAKRDYITDAKTHQQIVEGTYTWQYTCSVCSQVWTEEESFLPAVLCFATSGNGSNNYNATAGDNYANSYADDFSLIQPGTTLYYETKANDATYTDNRYMVKLTDADKIAAGEWNVKFDYPIGGTPVLTLKNAEIINNSGLWYGYAGFNNMAPLTVVLEGSNRILQTYDCQGAGPLMFLTNNPVTITGGGSLYLKSWCTILGMRTLGGNLTFDNVNIVFDRPNANITSTRMPGIFTCDYDGGIGYGDLVFNNSTLTYVAFGCNTYTTTTTTNEETGEEVTTYTAKESRYGYTNLFKAKNITISNSNITAHGTFQSKSGIIYATNDLTISESTLKLAHGYAAIKGGTYKSLYANAFMCNGTATFNYANGVTGKYSTGYTFADTHLDWETITYPSSTEINSVDTLYTIETKGGGTSGTCKYLEIAPSKALANFTGTSVTVKEDLDVNFKLDADKVDADGTVKFTVNGVETTKPLSEVGKTEGVNDEDFVITLPGLTAKEMATEITVTVYDSEGKPTSETKSDSVQSYALRLLRDNKYADDTNLTNKAMKTFVVDMLKYGAMAQVQFGDGKNLVTDALNANEWDYATAGTPDAPANDKPSNEGYLGTAFELKSDIGMAIALDAKVLTDVAKATVTFEDYKGVTQTLNDIAPKDTNEMYHIFVYDKLTAANGRQKITWIFYNSNDEVVLTITDSLAAYAGRMRGEHTYLNDILKYCDSAATYFKLINA